MVFGGEAVGFSQRPLDLGEDALDGLDDLLIAADLEDVDVEQVGSLEGRRRHALLEDRDGVGPDEFLRTETPAGERVVVVAETGGPPHREGRFELAGVVVNQRESGPARSRSRRG